MIPRQILNYTIVREIGAGGMGRVFLARNEAIGTYVAIKALHPRFASNPELRKRFRDEARLLSSLNHPAIVKFLNYVENETGVYLIMEYVEGSTLEDYVRNRNGLIVEERALPMITSILDAFAYAHKRGIVHRDIKPDNILLTRDGEIKVLDFGIAAIVAEAGATDGSEGAGTPSYMSPEQVLNRPLDMRSDIYSLGVLVYEMLTGRTPYNLSTMSVIDIKTAVARKPLPPMKQAYPYISDGAQKLVDRATAKNPADRFADCEEMLAFVDTLRNPVARRRRRLLWPAVAVGCAVLAGAGLWIWDYNRVKVRYYRDYVEQFEVPVGLGELSAAEASHRETSYRMEYQRRKLRRVTLVNGAGRPVAVSLESTDPLRRYSDVQFFYTDNGSVDYKRVYDAWGKSLFKLDYDDNLATVSFRHDDEYGTPSRMGVRQVTPAVDSLAAAAAAPISRMLLKHDETTGRLTMARFAGTNNEPLCDADRFFAYSFEYDDRGRLVRSNGLDINGRPRNDRNGRGSTIYEYDDNDNIVRVTRCDVAGKPVDGSDGYAITVYTPDSYGNVAGEAYYKASGAPAQSAVTGACAYRYEYDDRGNRLTATALDAAGKAVADRSGAARCRMTYDNDGNMVSQAWLDASDRAAYVSACGSADSVSVIRREFDNAGHVTRTSYFDAKGLPMTLSKGYAAVAGKYDDAGNLVSISYYGAKGEPAGLMGYNTSVTRGYDNLSRLSSERFLGGDGAPALNADGSAGADYEYDAKGNLTAIRFVSADGRRNAPNRYGVASLVMKYDETGNCVQLSCLNASGGSASMNGLSRVDREFDPATNLLRRELIYGPAGLRETRTYSYDADENLVNSSVRAGKAIKPRQPKPGVNDGPEERKGFRDYPSPDKARKIRLYESEK